MEVLMLAMALAWFGYRAHRRQMRSEARTELMEPQTWQPYTELWTSPDQMPTQARMSERTQRWLTGDAPETTLWRPDQTMPWMPGLPTKPVTSMPSKPKPKPKPKLKLVPATRFDTWINAVALISGGVIIAVTIVLVGLAV